MAATGKGVRAREPMFNTVWLPCEPIFVPLRTRSEFIALMREHGATSCATALGWPIKPRPRLP